MKVVPTNYVQTPLGGEANRLDITVIAFPLFPTTVEVLWKLYGTSTVVSKEGLMTIPSSVVSTWGTDDTVIKDYVLQQLNLTEDTTPDPVLAPEPPASTGDTGTL